MSNYMTYIQADKVVVMLIGFKSQTNKTYFYADKVKVLPNRF